MKKTSLLAVLTAGAMMISGCSGANSKLGKTAIEVNDTKVTLGDISAMASQYVTYYGFDEAVNMLKEDFENSLKYAAVAEAMGIELTDEDKEMVVRQRASMASQTGGLKKYEQFLKDSGSSLEKIESLITASYLQTKVVEKIQEELGDAEATDEELKAYFVENYMRAKHVLVEKEEPAPVEGEEAAEETTEETKEKVYGEEAANDILERAKNGENFDELVKTYSTDPGSESNPDGYVFKDGDMVPEFQECVESLKPGEFGICESDYGYHIIQRLPLSAEEEKFETWYSDNSSAVASAYDEKKVEDKFNELCEEHGVTATVYEEVIESFEEADMVEAPVSQSMMG